MTFALPAREVARGTGALMRGMAVEWAIDPSPADAHAFEEMLAASYGDLRRPSTKEHRMTAAVTDAADLVACRPSGRTPERSSA